MHSSCFALSMVAALLLAGCSSDDGGGDSAPPMAGSVDVDALEAIFDQAGISAVGPGCAAAVGTDHGVVWSAGRGLADLETEAPIDEDTVFDIASTSKQFTATSVLLLEEEGALSLDDPVAEHVAGLPAWAADVTLDQLMHHTSGIPDYIELLADEGVSETEPASMADALDAIGAADGSDGPPGAAFAYSNSNYLLLAEVVRAASGSDLGAFVAREVFAPLDIEAILDPQARPDGRATSYVDDGAGYEVADSPWTQVGDGAVQTTPAELVLWAEEYWSPRLGGPALSAARLDGAVPDPETGGAYGAGIEVFEEEEMRVLSHGGSWSGFVTDLVILPDERVAAAVSCNAPDVADPSRLAEDLLEAR